MLFYPELHKKGAKVLKKYVNNTIQSLEIMMKEFLQKTTQSRKLSIIFITIAVNISYQLLQPDTPVKQVK